MQYQIHNLSQNKLKKNNSSFPFLYYCKIVIYETYETYHWTVNRDSLKDSQQFGLSRD